VIALVSEKDPIWVGLEGEFPKWARNISSENQWVINVTAFWGTGGCEFKSPRSGQENP
jgi:hypothetical protein